MNTRFPIFQSHSVAICFGCGSQLLGEHKESDYPVGRGHWVKKCDCGYSTWYDLSEVLADGLRGSALAEALRERGLSVGKPDAP